MAQVYIGIGSNIQPRKHVMKALNELETEFGVVRVSPVYEAEAVGFDGPAFYNLVALVETEHSVQDVQLFCKNTETKFGRNPDAGKFTSRTLDLDLLLYDDLVQQAKGDLEPQLPRKEITENAFVLKPLADLAPYVRHPVFKKSFSRLANEFDKNQVLSVIHFDW